MKNKKLILSLLGLAMISFSCHDDNYRNQQRFDNQPVYPEPVYQQPQQVVIQERNSAGDLITGMAAGAILHSAISSNNSSTNLPNNRTIIRKTVIINNKKTVINRNNYRPSMSSSRSSYIPNRSSIGSSKSSMKSSFGRTFVNKRR